MSQDANTRTAVSTITPSTPYSAPLVRVWEKTNTAIASATAPIMQMASVFSASQFMMIRQCPRASRVVSGLEKASPPPQPPQFLTG